MEFETTCMTDLSATFSFYAFEPSFCSYYMHLLLLKHQLSSLKVVWKRESGPKTSGFFQNYVWDPRSQDPDY